MTKARLNSALVPAVRNLKRGKPVQDLSLQKFHLLRAIDLSDFERKRGVPLWNCICDCGNAALVRGEYLRYGHTRSCGCDLRRGVREAQYLHGMSASQEHSIWRKMQQRCTLKTDPGFKYYGGRGIEVCKRWLGRGGFNNFYADMGPIPTPKHTIERVDVNGCYEPSNCHWATRKEQARNTRRTLWVEWDGQRRKLVELCEEHGLNRGMVIARIKLGWSVKDALLCPSGSSRRGSLKHVNIYE
jgi:hypothetical protein